MNLRILLPTRILIDRPVDKVITEAENGSFCLLPRHIDFVAALVPGLLSFMADQEEQFVAIDEGVLVKNGANVLVSVRDAVIGPDLGLLRLMVRERFEALDEREKRARSALVRLEADFVRRFIELRE
jgi:F-type H+-transporting ATPase subunit epsilon